MLRLRQFKASCAVLVQQDAEREAIRGFAFLHRCQAFDSARYARNSRLGVFAPCRIRDREVAGDLVRDYKQTEFGMPSANFVFTAFSEVGEEKLR
jgi:hypothetical protein